MSPRCKEQQEVKDKEKSLERRLSSYLWHGKGKYGECYTYISYMENNKNVASSKDSNMLYIRNYGI